MKFIDTPVLRVGYEEWNAEAPHAVLLLHGWPDSPRCWSPIAPLLAAQGHRVIVPALRGFAPTRFLHESTPRSGQLSALGRDVIELLQALHIDRASLVGHDWGARAAANACGLQPGIATHLAMLSVGYGTNDPHQAMPLTQARNYWYHWYMATDRGARDLREERRGFTRLLWDTWSPAGWVDPAEFAATAEAFDGEDWVAVVLHSYRHRWGWAEGDPRYAADELALQPAPVLAVPTLVIHGEADSCNEPATSAHKERWFEGVYRRELLPGVGHFPQREAPAQVARLLLDFLAEHS